MSQRKQERIEDVEKYGIRAKGRAEYIAYLNGKPITNQKRIHAKCYECMGYYSDGKDSCNDETCPLYGIMPYRGGNQPEAE